MGIEVGEYVRTKTGFIGKLNKISNYTINNKNKTMYLVDFGERVLCISIKDIAKHSKNIIDLVEVGDVISYRIDNISTTLETKGYIEGIVDIADNEMLQEIKENKDYCIKSILTREQFAQSEYKIKEDK